MTKTALATMASVNATCRAMRNTPALWRVRADRMGLTGMFMTSAGFQLPGRLDSGCTPDRISGRNQRHQYGERNSERHDAGIGMYCPSDLCFKNKIQVSNEAYSQQDPKQPASQTDNSRFHKILSIDCAARRAQRPPYSNIGPTSHEPRQQ